MMNLIAKLIQHPLANPSCIWCKGVGWVIWKLGKCESCFEEHTEDHDIGGEA